MTVCLDWEMPKQEKSIAELRKKIYRNQKFLRPTQKYSNYKLAKTTNARFGQEFLEDPIAKI